MSVRLYAKVFSTSQTLDIPRISNLEWSDLPNLVNDDDIFYFR